MDPIAILEGIHGAIAWCVNNYKGMVRAKKQSAQVALRCQHLDHLVKQVEAQMEKLKHEEKTLLIFPLAQLKTHVEEAKTVMEKIPDINKLRWAVVGSSQKKKLEDCEEDLSKDETSLTTAQSTLTNKILIGDVKITATITVEVPHEDDPDPLTDISDEDKRREMRKGNCLIDIAYSLVVAIEPVQ